ncbi:AAA family ATPase [Clostridium sp. AWRP]|uniref:AAA family ATPase n=1 Tax=Clostridium sp. AWRP TaxID=2212991 RepID=UPI001586F16B|nr:AAA family ATPase [Clostridium sp. AWRP]
MKINKLQVGSFGKFKDYELEFKNGFQLIYGKNEDGKSTLMAFIKIMFYSKLERGKDINKNLRKKYQPWDGSMMNGAIEFEHDGTCYRLQKDMGATPGADKVKLINMDTGEEVSLGKNEEIGKRFFGLDLDGFERSVYISNIGSFSSNRNNDEVAEKLMSNLVLSGDENVSQQLVINRINDAIEDMESKRGKKGILVEAKNELDSLHNEMEDIRILEDEQKKNMEEYHCLKTKLDEQKNIKDLLELNTNRNRLKQINSLIEKIMRYTESEKKLEKENIPFKSIKAFLTECNSLMDESEKLSGSLEKLKGSIKNEDCNGNKLIPVSEKEYECLNELVSKGKTVKDLLKRIDECFLPAFRSFIEAKNSYQNAETLLKKETELAGQLQKFHEAYRKYEEEKSTRIMDKEKITRDFEKDRAKWHSEKQLREQHIEFTSEKLSMQGKLRQTSGKERQNKNSLLIFSVILGVISLILAVKISPIAAIGVVAAAGIGVFAIKSDKQSEKMEEGNKYDSTSNLKHELQNLKVKSEREDKRISDRTKDYEDKIADISNKIDKIEEKLKSLIENNSAYMNSMDKCSKLKNEKDIALNYLNTRQSIFSQELNYMLEKYSENSNLNAEAKITALKQEDLKETDAVSYRNKIEELYNAAELEIKEKMNEKSCTSIKEYENKYLEYASNMKNHDAVTRVQEEYLKKSQHFLNKLNEYEITPNYEAAKALVQELQAKISQLEREKYEVLNIAKGMGYDSLSLDHLNEEKNKLEASIKRFESVGDINYSIEELKQKDIASEDIEQQLFDLQKKIRTPDKNSSQIQEEIDEKEKEVDEKTQYFDCLKIALEVMQESSDEMRKSFGPELNRKTSEIFKSLTNGKYGNILVTKDYDISIQSGIHYREWKYLSNGTVDQVYLALRLAIADLISDKNIYLPLFLDDVLMQYDDERMDAALKFLSDYAVQKGDEFQLLLFTCHQDIIERAKHYTNEVVKI